MGYVFTFGCAPQLVEVCVNWSFLFYYVFLTSTSHLFRLMLEYCFRTLLSYMLFINRQTLRCCTSSFRCLCTAFFFPATWECLILRMIDSGGTLSLPEGTLSLRYLSAGRFLFPAAQWHISSRLIACWYCDERKLAPFTASHASEQDHFFSEVWLVVGIC